MVVQIKSKESIMDWLKKKNYTIKSFGEHFYACDIKNKFPCFNSNMFEYCNKNIIVNFDNSVEQEGYHGKEGVGNRDWFVTIEDKIELIELDINIIGI